MVIGGPHVTLVPEDAAPHADAIVVGYAEDTVAGAASETSSRARCGRRYVQAPDLSLAGRPTPRRDCCRAAGT